MSVVVFASDSKGTSSVFSTLQELDFKGIPYVGLVSMETQLQYPTYDISKFSLFTNQDYQSEKYPVVTLGIELPFKPKFLVIQRERWDPESTIIEEFKQRYNCKIGLIEPNAQILNNAETILETYSRNRFVPSIDVFFDHSTHIVNQRKLVGFKGNSVVVGNPKYDKNLEVVEDILNQYKTIYEIDSTKKQVLLYTLINGNRPQLFDKFRSIVEELKDTHQFFLKPYPGEPFDYKFNSDYNPKFIIPNVTPILDENHIWGMFNICDLHIGCLSSIFHAPMLLGKEVIDLSKELQVPENYLDKDRILSDRGKGIEESTQLWMRSFGFTDKSQLEELLPDELFVDIKHSNGKVWDTEESLLSLFDDFNDGQASKRIVNYIQNEISK
jgi:hypothetical protein